MNRELDVPGARLHYEVTGSGPVLLLAPGGAMDGAMFAGLVPPLAEAFTVVSYDPRGLGRSTVTDPAAEIAPVRLAEDAHLLLAGLGDEPAYVFGTSGGAITGFELVARHPGQVHTLVAHEPPVTELLPEREQNRAEGEELLAAYRTGGVDVAMATFMRQAGFDEQGAEPPPPDVLARMRANFDVFFDRMLRPLVGYLPDAGALRSAGTRIVVGGGTTSVGQPAQRAAVAVAELLGTELVEFPGDHAGYAAEPESFAARLREVLA